MRRVGYVGLCAAVLVVGLIVAARTAVPAPAATGSALLLPDLDPTKPDGMKVTVVRDGGKTRYHLGFISSVENVGRGPLRVDGARPDVMTLDMEARQIVDRADGSEVDVGRIGYLRYNADPTHQHWHLRSFMTYEIRRASDYHRLRKDRKSGFCLGDRYRAPRDKDKKLPRMPAAAPKRVYVDECAPNDPQAMEVHEGISVGWGDVYSAFRDGQYVDVTGLPAGQYELVHHVNADRRIRESNYANNGSSLVFDLHWPHGQNHPPTVELRGRCADSDRCHAKW
jgi:hypothetical protein